MDLDVELQQIFINFSKRKLTLQDIEGYSEDIEFRWDEEGSEGFAETVAKISDCVDTDLITYCFAELQE